MTASARVAEGLSWSASGLADGRVYETLRPQ
jgi:hypothetical protein